VTQIPHLVMACAAACCVLVLSSRPAAAQAPVARLAGTVKNIAGQPIKTATIRAVNPTAIPNEFTATSDQKGEWAILGMRGGLWEVTAGAPGFEESTVAVRVAPGMSNPSVQFVLVGTPVKGVMDGVDTKQLQASLSAAEALMVQQKWDEAVAEYKNILALVPSLDSVNLAIGRALRMKKDFPGAAAAYGEILKHDPKSQKAMLELGRTQLEQGDRAAAVATLEKLVAIDGTTAEAGEAKAVLGGMGK